MRFVNCLLEPRLVALVLTSLLASAPVLALPGTGQTTNALPPHPRLLLNAEGVAQLKERITTAPWAQASWNELKTAADRLLAVPVALPPRGGNWSHNYVCPTHGARLNEGRQLAPWKWEHTCPVGPHVLRGNPSEARLDFDGNAISSVHSRLAHQIVDHGLVFQVTGDARHAAKAREILLAYADRYLAYPLHDNQGRAGRGGRVASQSLTEAGWLTTFARGADLVWTTLSEADRSAIADRVLRPALREIILPRRLGIHNIQCHHNSAIGLVGFLLGDEALVATAIDDPVTGYRRQMEEGVRADGLWLEGSSGYHFYTINGVVPLTEAARNCGRDLYGPKLQSMFDGPLALAMPDFVLPNFNDSSTVPLSRENDLYELALARYRNPACLPLLARSNRRGRWALLAGLAHLPSGGQRGPSSSRNSPASGYAILQQGQGREATWLCVKYGPHGGGHGHPDKNNFILYARGQIVAPDAGTHAYGSPLHRAWDKTTLAHNTLTVDEVSQSSATGQCLAFGSEHGVDYVITEAGPIYPGLRFVRTVALLNSNLVVFVDQVAAGKPRTLDLAYHQNGDWGKLPAGEAWSPPPVAGYKYFTRTTRHTVGSNGLVLPLKIAAGWRSTVTLAGGEATEAITGYGILKTTEDRVPMLVQRRRSANTAFVWAVALDDTKVALRAEAVSDESGAVLPEAEAVWVRVSTDIRQWSLVVNPGQRAIEVTRSGDVPFRTRAAFALP